MDDNRKRILITGSRDWPNEPAIAGAIVNMWLEWGKPPVTVVHGGARGADSMAEALVSKQNGEYFQTEVHAVSGEEWAASRRAGLDRNERMVALGADVVLAFILNNSRGASHCLRIAQEAGIPAVIYRLDRTP